MKHIVRAFVVVLVLTGAAATTQTASASAKSKTIARTSAVIAATCAPNDQNAYGMPGR